MKIKSVQATPVNIPFVAPYRFSYGSTASLTKTVVEVETTDGIIGLGECADGDRSADVLAAAEKIIGMDVRAIGDVERKLVPGMTYTPWGNVLAHRRVFASLEIAMWDARAKTDDVPLWLLLGGEAREQIALTEYFSFRYPGPDHPGESTSIEIARTCAKMVEEYDSRIFEGKLATVSLNEEVEMVREIRAAIGDLELRLDANGGWTLPTAKEALRRIDPYVVSWYEEPVESYEELAALRSFTRASFSAHVVDLRKAATLGAPDAIVTNLNELGGIANAMTFIKACERFNVDFRFHSGETGVASAAYLQVSAVMDHVRDASQTLFRWYADDVIEGGPFVPRNGVVKVPDGPGLGVVLDRKALARCHERFRNEGAFPGAKGEAYGSRFYKS